MAPLLFLYLCSYALIQHLQLNVAADGCESGFNLVSASSNGKATHCPHIGGGSGYTLETCKQKTCEVNGNAFNWRPDGLCYYKLCANTSDIELTTIYGGYDVYAIQGHMCDAPLVHVTPSIHGVSTNCEHLGGGPGYTLDTCKYQTCQAGGNAFNWRPDGHCYYKLCPTSSLEYTTIHGGWDIYVQRDCANTGFTQVTPSSAGLSTNCERLGRGPHKTLDSCKSVTCRLGGNAFNWRSSNGECHYKLCQGASLELTSENQGWDIYISRDSYCGSVEE